MLADLGGADAVPTTLAALLDAATGSKILLDSLDRYIFLLAQQDGLVSRRHRRTFAIVADRMRVADGLTRQLQALGLERRAKQVPSSRSTWPSGTGRPWTRMPQAEAGRMASNSASPTGKPSRGRPRATVSLDTLRRLRDQEKSWRAIGRLLGIGASTALALWRGGVTPRMAGKGVQKFPGRDFSP